MKIERVTASVVHLLTAGALTTLLFGLVALEASQVFESQPSALMDEVQLREAAIEAPSPEYPADSLESKITGIAVAAIQFRPADGEVTAIQVLEAPDERIAAEVKRVLTTWRFGVQPELLRATLLQGRLTFYFEIVNGGGCVMSPEKKAESRRQRTFAEDPAEC